MRPPPGAFGQELLTALHPTRRGDLLLCTSVACTSILAPYLSRISECGPDLDRQAAARRIVGIFMVASRLFGGLALLGAIGCGGANSPTAATIPMRDATTLTYTGTLNALVYYPFTLRQASTVTLFLSFGSPLPSNSRVAISADRDGFCPPYPEAAYGAVGVAAGSLGSTTRRLTQFVFDTPGQFCVQLDPGELTTAGAPYTLTLNITNGAPSSQTPQ